ncbi:ShlB/FhaC/HecB family hemolysin secretion/activation protein [Martelella endophytica]|uniref:ShlB/FhaC/HecB family hemolysin secretion/activation protein n=1 Tax=Martelella endophytica TaxID=1486262 RepID=UPI0009E4C67C|nr:ShlB/FhaC/HecB family hemolysin secretion/activation protein [Martelella endophytica]
MRFSSAAALLTGTFLLGALQPSTVFAQTAGQVVEPSYAPPVIRQQGGALTLPKVVGQEAPEGADQLFVTPSGLDIEGGLPALAGETERIEAEFTDKRVSAADLFRAANELELAYIRAGYPLVRVSLPPQTIEDGQELKLVVSSGYVEGVDTAALPETVGRRVDAVMAPLVDAENPSEAEIERRLLLAGDTPGYDMKSTLKRGDTPGGTLLELAGRYDPVTGFIGVANDLTEELGDYSISAGVNFNNLLGLGEVGYLQIGGWPGFSEGNFFSDDPRNRQIVAGFTVPLGTDGVWLNVEGVDSRTRSDTGLGYDLPDHYQRLSANLGYDWLRSRAANASTTISFDIVDEEQTFRSPGLTTPFTLDRLRVIRLTQSGDYFFTSGARVSGAATLSLGLDGLGAYEPTVSLPMSRDGAEPNFQKLKAEGSYLQPLGEMFNLSLTAKAQTSFGKPLASSEQMGLGGLNWVSAYVVSEIEADTGAAMRAELSYPTTFRPFESRVGFAVSAAPYVFAAGGIAKLEQPTALEDESTRAGAVGLGIRFAAAEIDSPYTGSLTLEYAHGASNADGQANRFNLSFVGRF